VDVLVVNAGSSSVKLRVLDDADALRWSRNLPAPEHGAERHVFREALAGALAEAGADGRRVAAAGHRVVHGGERFTSPVRLDDAPGARDALGALDALADLAPLHNPPSLAAIHALRELQPDLPQVACFDTAFHARLPAVAATYALPRTWRSEGVRRYGFHGLSHAWASRRAAALLGRPLGSLRLVTAHLGAGASLAAVAGGRSVDTTMGFTPLEGLVMATRSGTIDPGALLWVQQRAGLSAAEVTDVLEHSSGLLGLSGVSGDLRVVLERADAGDVDCVAAYEVYAYRIRTAIGAMVAALGGLDGLVFTGGAGEASPRLRADVVRGLAFLGMELDFVANEAHGTDRVISSSGPGPAVVVVEAREDIEVARAVRALLGAQQ